MSNQPSATDGEAAIVGLSGVKRCLIVMSGKGGVGKSTVATQLAIGLWSRGLRVGMLDVDLCGPSVPRMFGLEESQVHQCSDGWLPVFADPPTNRLPVISIGFMLPNRDDAVVWRGPKKSSLITQLLTAVRWGELDWLVVDTPPGTSDEHLTLLERLKGEECWVGAIVVTTPQVVALNDVRRGLDLCRRTQLPVIGLVENMSGFVCPCCQHCTRLFGGGGGQMLADGLGIRLLGNLPLDPTLTRLTDSGTTFLEKVKEGNTSELLRQLTDHVILAGEDHQVHLRSE